MVEWKVVAKTKQELEPKMRRRARKLIGTEKESAWIKCEGIEGFMELSDWEVMASANWCKFREFGRTQIHIHTHPSGYIRGYQLEFSINDKLGYLRNEIPKACVLGKGKRGIEIKCIKADEEELKKAKERELQLYLEVLRKRGMVDMLSLKEIFDEVNPYREVSWEEI